MHCCRCRIVRLSWTFVAFHATSAAYPTSTLARPYSNLNEEDERAARNFCPWDAWKAYILLIDPPAPTGDVNEVWLPNIAKPDAELGLTVVGEEDSYPLRVDAGGFGGRLVTCTMPEPGWDNDAAMARLAPVCPLSQPPVMQCPVFDAWFENAPGGPLHDLVYAGALGSADDAGSTAPAPSSDGGGGGGSSSALATPERGGPALEAALALLDTFREAERLVKLAQWELDVLRGDTKSAELSAKVDLVGFAKRRAAFWGDAWGPAPKVLPSGHPVGLGGGRMGLCFEEHDAWLNASVAAEAELKRERKALDVKAAAKLSRLQARRDKLTQFEDGRFPGGSVDELDVNTRDVWGRTPLHWASAAGKELPDYRQRTRAPHRQPQPSNHDGSDHNDSVVPGDGGATSFAAAAAPKTPVAGGAGATIGEWAALVAGLLERGAAPNVCDVDGRTPLDLAVASGNAQAVRALLARGAGLETKNRWGDDPLEVARVTKASDSVRAALGLGPSSGKKRLGGGNNGTADGVGLKVEEDVEDELLGFLSTLTADAGSMAAEY